MKRKIFRQTGHKWKSIPRYHEQSADKLQALDEAIQECLKDPSDQNKKSAKVAAAQFYCAVDEFIDKGFEPELRNYSIEHYGCWECCLSMIAHDHQINFYEHEYEDDEQEPLAPNPENMVAALRSWQLLSPIGYTYDFLGIDPISVITRTKLQLRLHQDYGEKGIETRLVRDELIALCLKNELSVTVAVRKHPVFSEKDYTHWVLLDAEDGKLMVRDPQCENSKRFQFLKIYVICVYTTSSRKPPPLLLAGD